MTPRSRRTDRLVTMRILTVIAIAMVIIVAEVSGQVPVVNSASFIEWDDGNPGIVTETLVYISRDPGIVPDANPIAVVGSGIFEWAVTAGNGRWNAVVTARDPVSGIESGPSNEITFHVIGPPGNPRIVVPSISTSTDSDVRTAQP